MKIGLITSFFEIRSDIKKIIETLSRKNDVILFCIKKDLEYLQNTYPQMDVRLVTEKKDIFSNYLWERIFLLFRKIPLSRSNYYLMEYFKASNASSPKNKRKAYTILKLHRFLPKCISYKFFLDKLKFTSATKINDIDQFIIFSEITDDYLAARLIKDKKDVRIYVYSWDHPCKQTKFHPDLKYCVWSAEIKSDLKTLQNIPDTSIMVSGISQFCYLYDFVHSEKDSTPEIEGNYIYYGCAIGIIELVDEEIKLVDRLAKILSAVHPTWKLIVRPYPNLINWSIYNNLKINSNLILDDDFRDGRKTSLEDKLFSKYNKLKFAQAFIHCGTTLGIEACHTGTITLILDLMPDKRNKLSMYKFVHQYQNEKYFINKFPSNVIETENKLIETLSNLKAAELTKPNAEIPKSFALQDITHFTNHILN